MRCIAGYMRGARFIHVTENHLREVGGKKKRLDLGGFPPYARRLATHTRRTTKIL